MLLLGIDIGSTTAKAVLRREDEILYQKYERHYSQVREKTAELLREAAPITITCYDENAVRACASPLTLRKGRVTAETGTFLLNHGFEEWYHSVTGFAPSDNIHECLMP